MDTLDKMIVQEHFGRYLVALGMWPDADDILRRATNDAFDSHAEEGWMHWGDARRGVAAEQLVYKWTGIEVGDIDGLVGPQTKFAREAYEFWREHGELPSWRDDADEDAAAEDADTSHGPVPKVTHQTWPHSSNLQSFYGRPGPEVRSQLVFVECPWELTIDWSRSQKTRRIQVHNKCADSLAEILQAQLEHHGEKELRRLGVHIWGGAYNHRPKRGSKSSWSTHAYGCALDFDPSRNGLHTKAPQARLSHADAQDWWAIWMNAGWRPLGKSWGQDWMHVQATKFR